MINVLILFGGQSPEHEISLRSVRNVVSALDQTQFNAQLVGIDLNGGWNFFKEIPNGKSVEGGSSVKINPVSKSLDIEGIGNIQSDVVFPVLHGPNGEDGTIQGLLQLFDLPFIGPNVLGSSVAMDKDVAKILLASAGINVAKGLTLHSNESYSFDAIKNELGLPIFIKPANMGSSVGVHKIGDKVEFEEALKDAFRFDTKVVVEEMIVGRELECAVLGLYDTIEVTHPGEVVTDQVYSFDEKYSESSSAQTDIPVRGISEEAITELRNTAIRAFKALNCEIISRVDMFLTEDDEIYVNEINTLPGFTSISMYPKLWEYEGLSYTDLLTKLIGLAMKRNERTRSLKRTRL